MNLRLAARALVVGLTATIALLVVLLPAGMAQQIAPAVAATTFLEPFDGSPPAPQPYQNPHGWDAYTQGFNDHETALLAPGIRPSTAQHGPNCEPPGFPYTPQNSHPITSVQDTIFVCNNHVMTSPGLAGYAAVYMTVPALLDYSSGEAVLSFAMSTLVTSARDWPEVTLMPLSEYQELAFNQHGTQDSIDLSGDGCGCWKVRQRWNGGPNNTDEHGVQIQSTGQGWDTILAAHGLPEDLARRDTFEVRLARNQISVSMPDYGQYIVDHQPLVQPLDPAVWHDQAVVMISHRVYNAEKACSADLYDAQNIVHDAEGDTNCPPNTWHWDNVSLSPAIPFQIVQTSERLLSLNLQSGTSRAVSFQAPAPENATLHFVSFGDPTALRVSADGGRTWLVPTPRPIVAGPLHSELGDFYTVGVPAGTQSVMFRGSNGFWGSWAVEGISIWGQPVAGAPAPTPAPIVTAVPVATVAAIPTPVPATDTPTAVPATSTAVPTLQPTSTGVPTVTPSPTLLPTITPTSGIFPTITPIPTNSCQVLVFEDGTPKLVDSDACSTNP